MQRSTSVSVPNSWSSKAQLAWRERGPSYVLHKTLRRALGAFPSLKRRFLYADPKRYWTLRGGKDYFLEQEGQPARSARAAWLAHQIATYQPRSILEVGCGYGKQLRALAQAIPGVQLVGVDFSPTQLSYARLLLGDIDDLSLILASGQSLPFPDQSFDLVFTSAVILHNPPEVAQLIRRELVRVGRLWAAHNEDTDVTYNRYGHDTAAWYLSRGIPLAEVRPIPTEPDSNTTQFCVADLAQWRAETLRARSSQG